MEIFLSILFILCGNYIAFLSSVLSYLSQDKLKEILDSDSASTLRLKDLKLHYEEINHGYQSLEMSSYMIAATLAGLFAYQNFQTYLSVSYLIIAVFAFAFISRSILFALGMRLSDVVGPGQTPVLSFLRTLTAPYIAFTDWISAKINGRKYEELARQEIDALFESAREDGSLEAGEYRILKNIMQFSNVLVSDVMTPRTVVFSWEADSDVGSIYKRQEMMMYSRFPIWEGESVDEGIIGYVLSKDVLAEAVRGNYSTSLRSLAREVYFIPENAELDNALDKFLERREHLFVVVDEYGGVEGLLTMEDVLETMLGVEIVDEKDRVVDLRQLAKHRRDRRIAQLMKRSIH